MFTTIRSKLLTILLSFVLVTVTTSVIVFNYFEKSKTLLSSITQKAENAHVLLLKDIKVTHDFFENETINPVFFESGKSPLISQHQRICLVIDSVLNDLYQAQQKNNFNLEKPIRQLETDFKTYKLSTADLFKHILVRGFKDYGIEGKMRNYAHTLEDYQETIGLVNILQLRRHEKDFIIRQEDPYIYKHNRLISGIKEQLLSDKKLNPDTAVKIITTLNNYSAEFNRLVSYEKKLGLKSGSGLKKQIDRISTQIEASLGTLVEYSAIKEQAALINIKFAYLCIGFAFIISGIISALVISKKVSRSITHLKEKIDEFVKSDFTVRTILPINNSANEVDILATNFSIMEQHIVNQMNSLKQSNKDLEMLFYATSNDIRFPLIKAKELTEQALLSATDPGSKDYLQKINQSWESLTGIIDELGIITNIRNVDVKTELIDLEAMIRSAFLEFKSYPGFDNIIFSIDLRMKNKFVSSPGLVRAIFRNLIENGIKYATKRAGFSFLKFVLTDHNDDMLRVEVSDNGIGIKKEYQDKIFDMFFRGSTQVSGTGLGLYIVQCSLEKLDGSIHVESAEDKGTTFTLLIPNNYRKKNMKEHIIHRREISEMKNSLSLNVL